MAWNCLLVEGCWARADDLEFGGRGRVADEVVDGVVVAVAVGASLLNPLRLRRHNSCRPTARELCRKNMFFMLQTSRLRRKTQAQKFVYFEQRPEGISQLEGSHLARDQKKRKHCPQHSPMLYRGLPLSVSNNLAKGRI